MAYQGHFLLSGPALPAGVDWGEVRADSLAYKESRKQAHIVATGGTPAPPGAEPERRHRPPQGRAAGRLARESVECLVSGTVGEFPHSSLSVPSLTWSCERTQVFKNPEEKTG